MDTLSKLAGVWFGIQAFFYVLSVLAGIFYVLIVVPHMLSGGEWPKWYKKLKDRREKREEEANPITLKLN